LGAAQKEIKALEEKRHQLLAENRRLKGKLQATQKAIRRPEEAATQPANEDDLNATLTALEEKQRRLEARVEREQRTYQRKWHSSRKRRSNWHRRRPTSSRGSGRSRRSSSSSTAKQSRGTRRPTRPLWPLKSEVESTVQGAVRPPIWRGKSITTLATALRRLY
jgi:chromosome segregation ATPase